MTVCQFCEGSECCVFDILLRYCIDNNNLAHLHRKKNLIDCVVNVMCSLSDRIAPMCRSSLSMSHEVFYCKADIVKAMCLYLLGGLQGQGVIVSLN